MSTIRQLEPRTLWNHFADLNAIPRASKKEEQVIQFMKNFGEKLGLETHVDDVGNVVIKKPATPGMENRKTVILQSHLDMVHQKNADVDFDFDTEGIRMKVDGDWVKAEGTTLGADNGIGVASIMTLLESTDIPHPPLEALFTIDEETGMTGAKDLAEDLLEGTILLNLDTEEDNEFTIGCAGGINSTTTLSYAQEPCPENAVAFEIRITGLRGGHSGMDIHLGRANANKLMTRLLYKMGPVFGMRIAHVEGGGLRNAIPRECFATVVVPIDQQPAFRDEFDRRARDIRLEFHQVEPKLSIELHASPLPEKVMVAADQEKVLNALYAVPNGVFRMSPDIAGLVETSSNLAKVTLKDGEFTTLSLQRSAVESGKMDVVNAIRAAMESIGARVENSDSYPGWAPNPESPIVEKMEKIYEKLFDEKPHVAACHAGLECGIIGSHYPGLDMVSFGPTIRHAHSPDEMVSVSSVQRFWKFLKATLAEMSSGQ